MDNQDKKDISRRDFLKIVGISTAATTAALVGCDSRKNPVSGDRRAQDEVPADRMTYRTNPKSGERCRCWVMVACVGRPCRLLAATGM